MAVPFINLVNPQEVIDSENRTLALSEILNRIYDNDIESLDSKIIKCCCDC